LKHFKEADEMSEDALLSRIVVPLDGSDSSFRAARYAISIAKPANAEIVFMHAVVKPPYVEYKGAGLVIVAYIDEAKRQADKWYQDLGEKARQKGVKFSAETILDVTSAADSIVKYAENKKADLIVIGTKGRTGVKRFLVGSVASGVVSHAKCSVLVVR
jgi:nucleotide-binding universal stress UspA family protein